MGRLAGSSHRDVTRRLHTSGFEFDRHAKSNHEIWRTPATRRRTTVPNRPGDIPEGTVRAIIREAGGTVDEFLAL